MGQGAFLEPAAAAGFARATAFHYNGRMAKDPLGWRRRLAGYPYHAFLFSLYPVLFLYRQNIREVSLARMLPSLAVAIALAFFLWLGLRFIFPGRGKRALAVLVLLPAIYYYRPLHDLASELFWPGLRSSAPFFHHALLSVPLAAILILIHRSRHSFLRTARILNAVAVALLTWNIAGIVLHQIHDVEKRNARLLLQRDEYRRSAPAAAGPDIYCFILDEFARLDSIRDLFHHDHSAFAERLRAAGFFIAEKSRGPYAWTPEAIAAILNMERVPGKSDARLLIQRNKVARFLHENGYALFDFPYGSLTAQELSRRHYHFPRASASVLFDDFYRTLVEMSVFYPLVENWRRNDAKYSSYYRAQALHVFEKIPGIVKKPGPKFVLAHVFSPHAPFVFNRDGGAAAPEHFNDYSDRKYYLEQYLYISRKTVEMAETILKESAAPPIIIILSDHGYRGSIQKPFLDVIPEEEKKKVFLALHLPGYPDSRLDAALSPVNVFRVIFNHYFGQQLPLQPDPE